MDATFLELQDAAVIDRALGERVKHFRLARGMSLDELGRQIGVTYQQVQKYERGTNRISASTLFRMTKVLDIRMHDFWQDLVDETMPKADVDREALSRIESSSVRREIAALIKILSIR
jgi:predicted transcriptional regulator